MENEEKQERPKYRLNKKKFVTFLLALGFTAAFVAVAGISLANAGVSDVDTKPSGNTGTSKNNASAGVSSEKSVPIGTIKGRTILIDAGHGGLDPGAIAKDGTQEDELNLAVAVALKSEMEGRGVKVLMTRSDENAIAETKEADMAKRASIIKDCGADIVISIHMNSIKDNPDISGPLVLFMPGSDQGKALAGVIQDKLNEALETSGSSRSENLMVLRSGNQPAVLVECGYISNPKEEDNLEQADYQQKLAKAICDGAEKFFSGN